MLEFPFVPPGYDQAQVAYAADDYARRHGYRGPHMVMQEGHIEVRDGVPGTYIKYVDGQGMTTTEWTPLNVADPRAKPAGFAPIHGPNFQPVPGTQPAPQPPVVGALLGGGGGHLPDAQNPKAVAYAQMRLSQLRARGINPVDQGDPTATWRLASQGVAGAARSRGYDNPRDFLAGRKPNHPAPGVAGSRPTSPQHPSPMPNRPTTPQHPAPITPGKLPPHMSPLPNAHPHPVDRKVLTALLGKGTIRRPFTDHR